MLVDSGSQDRTLEIARQFPNVEILVRPFDNFINQKNHALQACRHDWVISLDADEMLTEPLIAEIARLPFDQAGYRIGRRSFIGSQEIRFGTWSPDYQLRLFRKSCGHWGGTNPHESIQLQGKCGHLKTRMLHYSYHNRREYVERNTKYIHLMVDYLVSKGKTAHPVEAYVHYWGNFFKAYFLRGGLFDGSTGYFLASQIAKGSFLKYQLLAQKTAKAGS